MCFFCVQPFIAEVRTWTSVNGINTLQLNYKFHLFSLCGSLIPDLLELYIMVIPVKSTSATYEHIY